MLGDLDDHDVEITPDIEASVTLFQALSTQWRVSMDGPTGIDYTVIPMLVSAYGICDLATVIKDIQLMESKALELIHKK
ncbi:DUF1799 domain-containing protein [Providencia rettgeri]|uniref:DUF1799 domain-containing protein n=1 Tax=Providencia rettgeri TaxID=587 RepID=UPI0018C661D0|nr:DUF1799 domain-containing protein [Providencia rettgeri]ELR5204609.1 DUF1799 domain-containing protein [Providencia rettgeri]MBG5925516.1 DUF1799 domain-containing protein [Providencia rettgeri]MBQ0364936.1 DUF1799 domain-containing protein [Providencia rettgeri]HEM7189106.1 DUF1799 domain-containing protein [Providencia rettgeri]HEM8210215.1 DUF1799 domain-containing protein [Providencia rettgeri]